MSPTEAAHILAPIHIGLLAARLRIQEAREAAESLKGREASRALADLEDAEDFIQARAAQWDPAGMLAAVEHGGRVNTWPNALPDRAALDALINAWAKRAGADLDALQEPTAAALVFFRAFTKRPAEAVGA